VHLVDRQDLQQPDRKNGWRKRVRHTLARLGHAVIADSIAQAVVMGIAAAFALSGTYFSYMASLPLWVVTGMLGFALALTVPITIGFKHSRQGRQLEQALAENADLTTLVESLKERVEALELYAGTSDEYLRARAEADRILADLLATILGGDDLHPPAWAESALSFERWLNDFTRDVIKVILRSAEEPVGMALIRECDGHYELVHRSSDVPREVVKLDGAEVRRELGDCIKRHAPLSVTIFGRTIDGHHHWVVVFPSREINWPAVRASLDAAAEMVLAAYSRYLHFQES